MSTNYRINPKRHNARLELLEHSNVFDLMVHVPAVDPQAMTRSS